MSFNTTNAPVRIVISIAAIACWTASIQAGVYDLTTDFSGSSNPNGAWSYELSDTPITSTLDVGYAAGWGYYGSADASILKVASASGSNFQPDDIVLHAPSVPYGGPTVYLDVKWTAPADGVISIAGKAWAASFFSGRDAQWWLKAGGTTLASNGSVYGIDRTDSAAQFASNLAPGASLSGINVAAGETVTLNVAATTYYGHFVGVNETINFTAVPEPSATRATATLSLLGLALFKAIRSRRFATRS